jgi:cytochrome c556
MKERRAVTLVLLSAVFFGGCGEASPYRAVMRDQTRALEDLEKTLSGITDAKSMRAARATLDARVDAFDDVKERARSLPPPTPEILRQAQEDGEKLRTALEKVQEQVRRINALPGGPELLQRLLEGFAP